MSAIDGNLQAQHPWEGRSIATQKFRLVEFSAYLDLSADDAVSDVSPVSEVQRDHVFNCFRHFQYHKHLFVQIAEPPSHPLLESVDVKEIYDKYPQKSGGLKELYEKGPQNAFFLVKFWADLNTNLQNDAGAFYGVSSQWVLLGELPSRKEY